MTNVENGFAPITKNDYMKYKILQQNQQRRYNILMPDKRQTKHSQRSNLSSTVEKNKKEDKTGSGQKDNLERACRRTASDPEPVYYDKRYEKTL